MPKWLSVAVTVVRTNHMHGCGCLLGPPTWPTLHVDWLGRGERWTHALWLLGVRGEPVAGLYVEAGWGLGGEKYSNC